LQNFAASGSSAAQREQRDGNAAPHWEQNRERDGLL